MGNAVDTVARPDGISRYLLFLVGTMAGCRLHEGVIRRPSFNSQI
ncbi:MAG: hypothetical protein WEB58_04845 [Planctomycetaceae bacterium]|jgi:hypothetical protein